MDARMMSFLFCIVYGNKNYCLWFGFKIKRKSSIFYVKFRKKLSTYKCVCNLDFFYTFVF